MRKPLVLIGAPFLLLVVLALYASSIPAQNALKTHTAIRSGAITIAQTLQKEGRGNGSVEGKGEFSLRYMSVNVNECLFGWTLNLTRSLTHTFKKPCDQLTADDVVNGFLEDKLLLSQKWFDALRIAIKASIQAP